MPGKKADRKAPPRKDPLAAPAVDANEEASYWRETFASRPYGKRDRDFSFYEPAYRYGWESARRHAGDPRPFEEVEPARRRLALVDGGRLLSSHEWHEAREAVRDAWRRIRGD